jgi:hypothetical protein
VNAAEEHSKHVFALLVSLGRAPRRLIVMVTIIAAANKTTATVNAFRAEICAFITIDILTVIDYRHVTHGYDNTINYFLAARFCVGFII